MSCPQVTWFANPHEHSLHYVKFGFMRLARLGEIRFRELPNHVAEGGLLPAPIRDHVHRRTVALRVSSGHLNRLLVLDGEDSIFQTSRLIQWCDLYLSCTYRRAFFDGAPFNLGYAWQDEDELAWYRRTYSELQQRYHPHLAKARPLAPIGPNMEWTTPVGGWRRRWIGLRHRLSRLRTPWIDWRIQHERFERRWTQLMTLRNTPPAHDVVLKDTLWGWPRHRMALHQQLAQLAGDYDIRSELHYSPASEHEGNPARHPTKTDLPRIAGGGVSGSYEQMLAASRLGVFATGFHWGCRNIVTLAWLLGLKVLSDPFIFESWFDFRDLETEFTGGAGDWREIAPLLKRVTQGDTILARPRIQSAFDRLMGPEVCARKVIETALGAV